MNINWTKTQKHEFSRYGIIPPSTPESAAACEKVLKDAAEFVAQQHAITENISNHRTDKARRSERLMDDATNRHTSETARRMVKHSGKKSDRGWFVTIAFMLPVCLCLGGILVNYVP